MFLLIFTGVYSIYLGPLTREPNMAKDKEYEEIAASHRDDIARISEILKHQLRSKPSRNIFRKDRPLIPEDGERLDDYLDKGAMIEAQFRRAMGREMSGSMTEKITPEAFVEAVALLQNAAKQAGVDFKISFGPSDDAPGPTSDRGKRGQDKPKR